MTKWKFDSFFLGIANEHETELAEVWMAEQQPKSGCVAERIAPTTEFSSRYDSGIPVELGPVAE